MDNDNTKILKIIYALVMLGILLVAEMFLFQEIYARGGEQDLLKTGDLREQEVNSKLPYRYEAIVPFQIVNSIFDKRYYPDTMSFVMHDGVIAMGSPELQENETPARVKQLYDVCIREKKHFLYVLCPGKPVDDNDLRDYGITCDRNKGVDVFIDRLKEYDVPSIDLRTVMNKEAAHLGDPYALFYKSDHHWTADAGLLAAQTISGELNKRYGLGLDEDAIDKKKMEREVVKKPFVGEMGAKLLGHYGSEDHLVIWRPSEEPRLRFSVPGSGVDRTGGFDILLDKSKLDLDMLSDNSNMYYYYMGGNNQLGCIENEDGGDSNILVIGDSYSCVTLPFLSLTAGTVKVWNMREDRKVLQYIENHPEIDTVILMYTLGFAGNSEMNDFQ